MHIKVTVEHKSGKGFDVHLNSYAELVKWAQEQEENYIEWYKSLNNKLPKRYQDRSDDKGNKVVVLRKKK